MKDLELSLKSLDLVVTVPYCNHKEQEADVTAYLLSEGREIVEQEFNELTDGSVVVEWLEAQGVEWAFNNQPEWIEYVIDNVILTGEFSTYELAANNWIASH